MIIVYSAANSVEAHMVKNLLEIQEIPAYVQGEHLQGGAGELPMGGLVKVSVDDSNLEAARKIIKEWESKEYRDIDNSSITTPKEIIHNGSKFLYLTASFILGAAAMHLYLQSPVSQNGIDYNNDGKNDEVWTYKNNQLTKTEIDNNLDGKFDNVSTFKNDVIDIQNLDVDFNGKFESEHHYQYGIVYYSKIDTNNDDEIDLIYDYETYNANYKVSIFDTKTKLLRKIQFYKMYKLIAAELDSNSDGKLDTTITYDFVEEEVSRKPILKEKSNS